MFHEDDIFDIAHTLDYNPQTGALHEWALIEKPSADLLARLEGAKIPLKQWRKFALPSEVVRVREVNPEPAGKIERKTGALVIYRKNRQFYAHVIVWLKCFGELPDDGLVHLNENRADNRIENLETVSQALKRRGKPYRARVRDGARLIHLGYFATVEERDAAMFAYRLGITPRK
jgi:hypothetical protein